MMRVYTGIFTLFPDILLDDIEQSRHMFEINQ